MYIPDVLVYKAAGKVVAAELIAVITEYALVGSYPEIVFIIDQQPINMCRW